MSIATKKGDSGFSSDGKGQRYSKDHPFFVLVGELDELNARLGLVKTYLKGKSLFHDIEKIQQELQAMMGRASLAGAEPDSMDESPRGLLPWLDESLKDLEADYSFKGFVLPGSSELNAQLHLARTQCRKAERAFATWRRDKSLLQEDGVLLNRLSDWLFLLAEKY